MKLSTTPSPLAGERGARRVAVGGCGGASRLAALLFCNVEVNSAADAAGPLTPTPLPQGERGFEVAL